MLDVRLTFGSVLVAIVVAGCATVSSPTDEAEPISYLDLPLDSLGHPLASPYVWPYVWERQLSDDHIVVLGTLHTRDPQDSQYQVIESAFARVRPTLVLHESAAPPVPDTLRDQAIENGGNLGFAAYLAGQYGADLRSGDLPEREEFAFLLSRFPARDVVVFLTAQRLISGYEPDSTAVADSYAGFFEGYIEANGVPERDGWGSWAGFLEAYEQVVGRPFTVASWDPGLTSPILDVGPLSDMARATNRERDRHLVASIRSGLESHDRVAVVFGGWHVLAVEPVLNAYYPE